MNVKICGITRAEDAAAAVSLGAWAIGFVFWTRSPRAVDAARARTIAQTLPAHVQRIGVFVDESPLRVRHIVETVGLTAVQLHGDEPREAWDDVSVPVIRAVGVENVNRESILAAWSDTRVLLDAHDPDRRGGTGRTTDWDVAAAIARRREVVLAGGLRPENVAAAIERVGPWGIDVSSGVEDAPGLKSAARLRALFEAVKRAGRAEARPLHG